MTDTLRDQLLGLGFKPAATPERPANNDRPPQVPRGGKPEPQARHGRHDARRRDDLARTPRPGDDAKRPPGGERHRPPRAGGPRPQAGASASHPAPSPRRDGAPRAPGAAADARRPSRPAQGLRNREDIDLAKAYAIRAQREKDERIAAEKARQEDARVRREAKLRLAELLKDQDLKDPAADIARHFDYGGKIKRIHVTADQLKALNAGELGVVQLDGRYLLVSAALLAQAQQIFAPAVALRVDPHAPAGNDPYADPKYQVPDDLVW